MNAAETIQAAIDKLTDLRVGNTPGYWQLEGTDYQYYSGRDADFVILHRTIDAQLAILHTGLNLAAAFPNSEWTNTTNLARAILGEDS